MANATRGADVAQLVEQLIRNEQVTGSIPAIGSIKIARPSGLVIFMGLNGGASQRFAPSTKREVPPPCHRLHFLFVFGFALFLRLSGGRFVGAVEAVEEFLAGVRGDDAV